ncbi:MAG: hypothetical protein RSB22_12045 [Acinetobacter sp.]
MNRFHEVLHFDKALLCYSSLLTAYEEYIPQGLAQLKSFALFFLFTHSIAVRLTQLKSSAFLNAAHVDNFVNNPVDNRVDKREDKLLLK